MDSTEIPVYGQQENSAYNGHFESTCYHPLLLFNREGDCLATRLRPGNVHSADDWEELLLSEIERQQKLGKKVVFRADLAFAKPEIYEALEAHGVRYAIRILANENLERDIAELAAVGTANPKDIWSFRRPHPRTFHGTCLAIVRPTGVAGAVTLRAQSESLTAASITLQAS